MHEVTKQFDSVRSLKKPFKTPFKTPLNRPQNVLSAEHRTQQAVDAEVIILEDSHEIDDTRIQDDDDCVNNDSCATVYSSTLWLTNIVRQRRQ